MGFRVPWCLCRGVSKSRLKHFIPAPWPSTLSAWLPETRPSRRKSSRRGWACRGPAWKQRAASKCVCFHFLCLWLFLVSSDLAGLASSLQKASQHHLLRWQSLSALPAKVRARCGSVGSSGYWALDPRFQEFGKGDHLETTTASGEARPRAKVLSKTSHLQFFHERTAGISCSVLGPGLAQILHPRNPIT